MTGEKAMHIEELVSLYEGEWLALAVVDRDKNGFPLTAQLIEHGSSRWEVREKIKARSNVYLKFAGAVTPAEYGFLYLSEQSTHRPPEDSLPSQGRRS